MYMKGEDCVRILLLQGKGDSELNLLVFCCFVLYMLVNSLCSQVS
uniref:Uncharacterized protein n=1 Tax=Populus trichocarpa TaxID=3694 RepID=A0A3N7GCP5_POPTR